MRRKTTWAQVGSKRSFCCLDVLQEVLILLAFWGRTKVHAIDRTHRRVSYRCWVGRKLFDFSVVSAGCRYCPVTSDYLPSGGFGPFTGLGPNPSARPLRQMVSRVLSRPSGPVWFEKALPMPIAWAWTCSNFETLEHQLSAKIVGSVPTIMPKRFYGVAR
jgi:hypothetical protein